MIKKIITAMKVLTRTLRIKVISKHNYIKTKSGLIDISFSSSVYGKNGGLVDIGSGIKVSKNTVIAAAGGKIEIGERCFIGRNSLIISHSSIIVGDNCMFGPGVLIYDHDHIFDEDGVHQDGYKSEPIKIEKKCWIGANTIILRGTIIGEGSVIGAGSVVKGIIPPHSVVTNNRSLIINSILDEK